MGSMFAGMQKAEVFTQGSYFEPGEYRAVIKEVLYKDTRKSGPAVIVEFELTESSNPTAPVGAKRSWVQTLKNKDVAFPNLLGFLAVLFDMDPNNGQHVQWVNSQLAPHSERFMEEVTTSQTVNGASVKGKEIRISAFAHTTKVGQTITRLRFAPAASK